MSINSQTTVKNLMTEPEPELRRVIREGSDTQMQWALAELRRRRESFNYGAERVIRQRGQELYA